MDKVLNIDPLPKPRMVKSDSWKRRPIVLTYWGYKKHLKLLANQAKVNLLSGKLSVTFIMPMPKSWTKKKREQMNGKPHQQTADLDNLIKALQDCLLIEDSHIYHYGNCSKYWGERGKIIFHDC